MTFVTLDNAGLLPGICVEVDATTNPMSTSRTWTDITALVRALSYSRSGRNQEINRSAAGSLTAICSDAAGAITGLGLRKRQWVRVRAMPPGNGALLLLAAPKLFWRLGDAVGSSTARDSSGNGNVGSIGAGVTLGQAGFIAGDPSTAALFNDSSTGVVTAASYSPFIVGSQRTFFGSAIRAATTDFDALFGGNGTSAPFLRMPSGSETVQWSPNGSGSGASWAAAWPGTGVKVFWALTYDDSTGIAELFINGASQGQQTVGASFRYSGTGGVFEAGASAAGNSWNGQQQDAAVCETIVSSSIIAAIYNVNTQGIPRWAGILETLPRKWPGQGADQLVELHAAGPFKALSSTDLSGQTFASQRNDQRVSAIIALASLTAGAIDTGTDTADAVSTPFADESMALDYLLQIEASENGLLIENPDGTISFQGRHWRYFNAANPLATFGETAGEIPYIDDAELDDDDSIMFNVAGVTPFGGSSAIVAKGPNATTDFPSRIDVQLLSSDTNLALSAAQWLTKRYGNPQPRIPALNIELAAVARQSATLVATLLAAANSSRFTWTRSASTPISEDVYVEQISETIDVKGGSWQLGFLLSPAVDYAAWVLGTSLLGQNTYLTY
jgi:hypothetical protein